MSLFCHRNYFLLLFLYFFPIELNMTLKKFFGKIAKKNNFCQFFIIVGMTLLFYKIY